MNHAYIKLTESRGVVAFASVKIGNKVLFESREWGDAFCAVRECKAWAADNNITITETRK